MGTRSRNLTTQSGNEDNLSFSFGMIYDFSSLACFGSLVGEVQGSKGLMFEEPQTEPFETSLVWVDIGLRLLR